MLNKIIKSFIAFFLLVFALIPVQAQDYYAVDVGYQAGSSGTLGDFAYGGALAGSEGGSALDSMEIHLVDAPYASAIEYRVYTSSGWSTWFSSFESASNNNEAILGIQVQLKDFPNANVYYQSYRQGLGWGIWVSNGHTSGTLNSAHPITGFRVQVDEIGINYNSNINGVTQVLRHNGETQGTGSLETVSMNLISSRSGSIEYRAYLRNSGWTDWASNGSPLGSSGAIIEALEARLIGLPQYSVQIQPQVEGEWWGYAYDGQTAGSIGSKLTAYRVKIVQKVPIKNTFTNYTDSSSNNNSPCPSSLGSDEIALWSNDSDIVLETFYVNSSQVRYESNIAFFNFYQGQDTSISVLMKDSNLLTSTFDLTDKAYACFGSNIASNIGFSYKEYNFSDIIDLNAYNDYYGNHYSDWPFYWYPFDLTDSHPYQYQEYNQFYPNVG